METKHYYANITNLSFLVLPGSVRAPVVNEVVTNHNHFDKKTAIPHKIRVTSFYFNKMLYFCNLRNEFFVIAFLMII